MVKKLQKMAEQKAASPAGLLDSQLASTIKESAAQIWLAGLGAFSKAQSEGGKVFEALVAEGSSLQRKTQAAAEEKMSEVTERMNTITSGVTSKAGAQWDKLESIFEDRVSRALGKLGVPAAKDVEALVARIDELSAQVAKLGKASSARAPKVTEVAEAQAGKAVAKKRAARKATA